MASSAGAPAVGARAAKALAAGAADSDEGMAGIQLNLFIGAILFHRRRLVTIHSIEP
jgi:hypothetical protein